MRDAPPSHEAPANLADYRLVRALRAGQTGAFASFWNAHAGPIWSVLRACCATESEAIGWTIALRMDLEERVTRLSPAEALPPQVGAALVQHALRERQVAGTERAAGPAARTDGTAYDPADVLQLPRPLRLLFLADVYFDLALDALEEAGGAPLAQALADTRAALDPVDPDTREEARAQLAASLYRAPPTDVLLLPPGAEPVPRVRWWPRILVGGLVALAAGGAWTVSRVAVPTAETIAHAHGEGVSSPSLVDADPVRLGLRLARANVSGVLAEAPDLSSAGFVLLGAEIAADAVTLVYHAPSGGTVTLQHLLRRPSLGEAPVAQSTDTDLAAYALPGGTHAVPWDERDTTWVLVGTAPPDALLGHAARIRQLRGEALLP